jgi:molecular chaperone Hsp33
VSIGFCVNKFAMNQSKNHNIGLVRYLDIIQPFMLNDSLVRGRMVRLDGCLNDILSRHNYHHAISNQLAEMMLIGAMLATQLPEGGILTLQIKCDGVVSFMVCDVTSEGGLRAYANVPQPDSLSNIPLDAKMRDVLGNGYLAITLDTPYGEPYQGIVPLDGESLTEAVSHYFTQSQQLDVAFQNCISKVTSENGFSRFVASGIMLERMPEISVDLQQEQSINGFSKEENEQWDYNKLLIKTATEKELTDSHLAPSALLYRLFNEEGVWIYDTLPITRNCRCSRGKIMNVLRTIPRDELQDMVVDGYISVVCQFCNQEELFTQSEIG